jgi:uncharacterized membrane-anchored protein
MGERSDAHISAWIFVSGMLCLNVMTVFDAVSLYFSSVFSYGTVVVVILLSIILFVNYFVFLYRKRYVRLLDRHRSRKKVYKWFLAIIVIVYLIFTFYFLIQVATECRNVLAPK